VNKVIFNILDDVFSHDKYSVAGRESSYIQWDRTLSNKTNPTFYSHSKMFDNIIDKNNSYGLLFESKGIIPSLYDKVEPILNKFDKVFTHNSVFLKKYNNCLWIPGGGVWIGGDYGKGEIKISEKNKLCSMVSSTKQMCDLHRFRLNIVKSLNTSIVDVFGIDGWVPIYTTLENYMFSIVVENFQDDLYFTEKLLNCFATGTIPIYFGAKNIGDKFNLNGIIQFGSVEELNRVISTISDRLYYEKLESIKDNFNRCKEFLSIEDYIYKNYF
jgi:hypothetical protein